MIEARHATRLEMLLLVGEEVLTDEQRVGNRLIGGDYESVGDQPLVMCTERDASESHEHEGSRLLHLSQVRNLQDRVFEGLRRFESEYALVPGLESRRERAGKVVRNLERPPDSHAVHWVTRGASAEARAYTCR